VLDRSKTSNPTPSKRTSPPWVASHRSPRRDCRTACTVLWGSPFSIVHTSRLNCEIRLAGSRPKAAAGARPSARTRARARRHIGRRRGRIRATFAVGITASVCYQLPQRRPAAAAPPAAPHPAQGTIEGIRYRIRGAGPPLVLFPLSLSPSQWSPLIDSLAGRYCVVELGGAHLGAVALLEERAASGYGELVMSLAATARLGPGEVALEVGCGSGALSRALLARSAATSRIVATDLNPYLIEEAAALVVADGDPGALEFVSLDQQLNEAALREGLKVIVPS